MAEFENKIKEVQKDLKEQELEGWLLYDYHHANDLAYAFLEISCGKMATRRFFYWIPQKGEPIKIVSLVEPYALDHLPGAKWYYRGWQDLERLLFSFAVKNGKIAMEYSPYNALPNVSRVDAGIVELIRKTGAHVVSSANLLQKYTSVWSPQQLESHLAAAHVLDKIAEKTWSFIEHSLQQQKRIDEYQVQQFMLDQMDKENCITDDWPICAVNGHSADPHYFPVKERAAPIRKGDFILIDLWCKQKIPHSVYADITRVGVAAAKPSSRQEEIFQIVRKARDHGTNFIQQNYQKNTPIQGWQVDQMCRDVISDSGYGDFFIHRTGHNIGEVVHGPGANLDNLETHDYRTLISGTCFSMEPGIYLPQEFGVRLEYDIYLNPNGEVMVTGGIQEQIAMMSF